MRFAMFANVQDVYPCPLPPNCNHCPYLSPHLALMDSICTIPRSALTRALQSRLANEVRSLPSGPSHSPKPIRGSSQKSLNHVRCHLNQLSSVLCYVTLPLPDGRRYQHNCLLTCSCTFWQSSFSLPHDKRCVRRSLLDQDFIPPHAYSANMIATSLIAFLLALTPAVSAHGQLRKFISSSGTYTAADAYTTPLPDSPIRKISEYGPAAPFTGKNITCGPGGNIPVAALAGVTAGETVTFDWGSWGSSHSG